MVLENVGVFIRAGAIFNTNLHLECFLANCSEDAQEHT